MSPLVRQILDLAMPLLREYAIVVADPEGVIIGWLGGAEEVFGFTAEEILGKPLAVIFVPEDVEKDLHRHEREVARRAAFAQDDRWHLRKDGSRIWVTGSVTAVRDAAGELLGYVKVMRERGDLKMAAEARAREAAASKQAIEDTARLISTVGHELRNPLGPIRNSVFILRRLSVDERVLQAAERIEHQVAVLERVTGDLMDAARVDNGRLELQLAVFDVRKLLEEEVQSRADAAERKGLFLETLVPDKPLTLEADEDRLRQAVGNLVTNAIKYTPAGGRIWVKATREGDDVVVRVEDTGIGIAPESLSRIFELFTREEPARTMAPAGLGVGLAMVNAIARSHGGLATARSGGVGKGSEFMLRMPRRQPAVAAAT